MPPSPGIDEWLFRTWNLAGSDPILDRIMIFFTILTVVYVIFLVAVPLWWRGLRLHWPSCVLGGAAVGIGFALLVEVVSRRVEPYQRIRARIVEAIPHLSRRSRGT